ncbi:MAG TPA: heme ABC transporter ATP-binding protein, partial [Ferruginibacter sp.]|nr:heme ABC transporter ATP-binding protein [Ferruginibacter sp.]
MLRAEGIGYTIEGKQILQGIDTLFLPGQFNMILGPNGSGKSSLLKIISGEISNHNGKITYDGTPLASLEKEELAKFRAVMSQQPELSFPLTAEEVVMMGRYPHFVFNPGKKDEEICRAVMEKMNLQAFRERNYLTLSGGEKQRVQYARVLAQVWEKTNNRPRYLFLDEPLNSLDIHYQQEFLQLAREFQQEDTVLVAVLHDINLAIQYADRLFFLKEGRLAAQGSPEEIVTEELIHDIFNVRSAIIRNPVSGAPGDRSCANRSRISSTCFLYLSE